MIHCNRVFPLFSVHKSAVEDLENFMEETKVNETTSISVNNIVAVLYKPTGEFKRLEIHANDKEVKHIYHNLMI